MKEYMKLHVSRIKYLTGGVIFIDAIPKNPVCRTHAANFNIQLTSLIEKSGKIIRKILRDRAKEEVRSVQPKL